MAHKQQALINVNKMIQIFVTGGTFDKEYNELNGSLFFKDTHLPEMLEKGRSRLDVSIDTLLMKDSLDFNDVDRQLIAFACASASADRILITHGTDTMVQTAQYLASQKIPKTIVLTGAMIPYKFGSSDGMFNLGSALAFLQILEPGVYISMNGKIFATNNVRKNLEKGEFETIN
ncbi:MAG: asparaginase [Cytophagales bacterium]|nr:asparaginase [Cytophagales bacterium]